MGLNGACVFDVFGLKHISLGYTFLHMSTGMSSFVTMPIAGIKYFNAVYGICLQITTPINYCYNMKIISFHMDLNCVLQIMLV